jgi:cytochrome c
LQDDANIEVQKPLSLNIHKNREEFRMRKWVITIVVLLSLGFGTGIVSAAENGTKDEAVAMVKKAVQLIQADGNEKAFEEFSNPAGKFVDRDLYIAVYDMTGKCVAHGANPKMIGRDLIDNKDVDGKEFVKERIELMKAQQSAWQDYKFRNPVSNQIEQKSMYIERSGDLIVGCGIYKQ